MPSPGDLPMNQDVPASSDPVNRDPSASGDPQPSRRTRGRKMSRTRQIFLGTIHAQIKGTRVLAGLALLILVGSGALWLAATTGSPVIGVYFIAMGAMLSVTVYWFLQVMGMLTGKR